MADTPTDKTPLVELIDVTRSYPTVTGGSGAAPAVLRGVNLRVEAGQSLAIVGPSGSGKSTLLHILGALDRPTTGRAIFEGHELGSLDDEQLAALRNRSIGIVFQAHHLLPYCTAIENVLVPTLAVRSPAQRHGAVERARQLLDRVGLADRAAHRPGQLSGGERQRVALVRALINEPHLLLADEPTGSLDHASALGLAQLMVELNRERGLAMVVVTHSTELARRMGAVLALRDGLLVPDGGA